MPSIAAGAIIGKGGETIAQVQKEAGARVKMSKANDFYPGMSKCQNVQSSRHLPRYATKKESDLKKDTAASFCLAH